jgi:hypothetical protein
MIIYVCVYIYIYIQAAVPKHAKVQINPPSSTTVPPSASGVVTQASAEG